MTSGRLVVIPSSIAPISPLENDGCVLAMLLTNVVNNTLDAIIRIEVINNFSLIFFICLISVLVCSSLLLGNSLMYIKYNIIIMMVGRLIFRIVIFILSFINR